MADKEVLSQDEVDALLTSVDEGDVATESSQENSGDLTVIDFANQERIVHSQFPVLERIYERFSRKTIESIYDLISTEIEAEMDEVKVIKFGEFINSFAMPTAINIIRIHPLRGKAMIVFDTDFVFSMVENYFGGDGRYKNENEEREFTQSEQHVAELILSTVIADFCDAWSPILELNVEFLNTEMNPQLVNIASATDVMIVSPFTVKTEKNGGIIYIVMPYTMLEPIRDQLDLGATRGDDEIDPNWVNTLKEDILDVPLELSSTLTETTLSLGEVLHIKPGDVIPIEMPEQVTLKIEDIPSFRTQFGISNDKCGLKITEIIKR